MLIGALLGLLLRPARRRAPAPIRRRSPTPTLLSVREQGRLTVFIGRFVAVVTASESRLGLTARKTLIMPGNVRYGVDLARLRRQQPRLGRGDADADRHPAAP